MYWEPAKYVAKLRTLKTDTNPLLLVTNMQAGHGGASGRYDYLKEIALDYAFLLRELGARVTVIVLDAACADRGEAVQAPALQLRQRLFQARRVFHVQRFERRIDLLEQAAQHFAGPDFDEDVRARGFQRLHAIDPAHRARDLADKRIARGFGRGDQARRSRWRRQESADRASRDRRARAPLLPAPAA